MLDINLKHIETTLEYTKVIKQNENVVIICGGMGPLCIPVYVITEKLEDEYKHVRFYVIEFDKPISNVIRTLPEVQGQGATPFIIYYKNGKVVKGTSSIQCTSKIKDILDKEFGAPINLSANIQTVTKVNYKSY